MKSIPESLEEVRQQNSDWSAGVLVLEQNENSDLFQNPIPINRFFFESVFSPNGPYWSVLKNSGLAETPADRKFAWFVGSKMFFLKNVEQRYCFRPGLEERFEFRNGRLRVVPKFDWQSPLCLLSLPREIAGQQLSRFKTALHLLDCFSAYPRIRQDADLFWNQHHLRVEKPGLLFKTALDHAVSLMEYSFWASLGYSLRLRIQSKQVPLMDLRSIAAFASKPSENQFRLLEQFVFFSQNPYDLAGPRLWEQFPGSFAILVPSDPLLAFREEIKFLAMRFLGIGHECLVELGKQSGLHEEIFWLYESELKQLPHADFSGEIENRKKIAAQNRLINLPAQIVFDQQWQLDLSPKVPSETIHSSEIFFRGVPVGDPKIAVGRAVWANSEDDFEQDLTNGILVSDSLWPDLTLAFSKAKAVVAKTGGPLSHAAIVAREYHLPCIVQVSGIDQIQAGDWLEINGKTGEIKKTAK